MATWNDLILYPLPVALAILAAALLWRGWLGRRVGDHPFCHHCGFDLFGLPSGSNACSECGANITRPGAMHIGRRTLLKGRMVVGLLLLIAAALYLGAVGYGAWNPATVIRHEPGWWLAWKCDSDAPAARQAALAELSRRMANNTLGQANVDRVVGKILAAQADPKRTWDIAWGDFVEAAKARNQVQDADWKRYARQGATSNKRLEVRAKVRRGQTLLARFGGDTIRGGRYTPLDCRYVFSEARFDEHDASDKALSIVRGSAGFGLWQFIPIPASLLANLAAGPHTLHMKVHVDIFNQSNSPLTPQMPAPSKPLISHDMELEATFTLVPADELTVRPIVDPALRLAVEKCFSVWRMKYPNSPNLHLQFWMHNPPVDLAYDVYARGDGKEWKLGTLHVFKGVSAGGSFDDFSGHGIPSHLNLLLKPSAAVAEHTVTMTSYWDHELLFEDIPLSSVPRNAIAPTSQPTSQATTHPSRSSADGQPDSLRPADGDGNGVEEEG